MIARSPRVNQSYVRCSLGGSQEACRALWQSQRQAVALTAAFDERDAAYARIAALEDDNRRLRLALGHPRAVLGMVGVQDAEAL